MDELARTWEATARGDQEAASRLWPLVYDELRRLAARKLAGESPGQTLQATALVHEVWLKLGGDRPQCWRGREHFLAAAAQAMRRILVDRARRRRTARHGGEWNRLEGIEWEEVAIPGDENEGDQLLALHDALEKFETEDPERARIVELRYFGGLSVEEAAKVMGVSVPTAKRRWAYARAWLFRELSRTETE